MNLKNFIIRIRKHITQWVIVKYLSGGVNPYALLAARLQLRVYKDLHARHKNLTGDEYELPNLTFIDSDDSRYMLTRLGFILVHRQRAEDTLQELQKKYEVLADKARKIEKQLEKKELYIQELRLYMAALKNEIRLLYTQLSKKSHDTNVIEFMHAQLDKSHEKNLRMIFNFSDIIGAKKKSYIIKILGSDDPVEIKISRIEKYLCPPKVGRYVKRCSESRCSFFVKWLSFFM